MFNYFVLYFFQSDLFDNQDASSDEGMVSKPASFPSSIDNHLTSGGNILTVASEADEGVGKKLDGVSAPTAHVSHSLRYRMLKLNEQRLCCLYDEEE